MFLKLLFRKNSYVILLVLALIHNSKIKLLTKTVYDIIFFAFLMHINFLSPNNFYKFMNNFINQ